MFYFILDLNKLAYIKTILVSSAICQLRTNLHLSIVTIAVYQYSYNCNLIGSQYEIVGFVPLPTLSINKISIYDPIYNGKLYNTYVIPWSNLYLWRFTEIVVPVCCSYVDHQNHRRSCITVILHFVTRLEER